MAQKVSDGNKSTDKLIELAKQASDTFNWGVACQYYREALEIDPNNAYFHHKIGIFEQELGNSEKAHESFIKSISLSPNENATNYLYIAQYCQGQDSESAYLKAIEILKNDLKKHKTQNNNNNNNNNTNDSKSNENDTIEATRAAAQSSEHSSKIKNIEFEISNACVSVGELYTTDLCEIENAETIAEKYFLLSIKWCICNPEAHSCLGEFRLLQSNLRLAKESFHNTMKYLFGNESDFNLLNNESITIDSLLKISKFGIECECFNEILVVLGSVLRLNDNNGQAWGLGSLAHFKLHDKVQSAIWLNNAQCIYEEENDEYEKEMILNVLNVVRDNIGDLPDLNTLDLNENNDDNENNNENDDSKIEDMNEMSANFDNQLNINNDFNARERTYIAKRKEPDFDCDNDDDDQNMINSFLDNDNDDGSDNIEQDIDIDDQIPDNETNETGNDNDMVDVD